MSGPSPLDWTREGPTWPNAAASRLVSAGDVTFHVQTLGQGPVALLIHGTGASTHSWRHLVPLLAPRLTLVMLDLPGHAFSSAPGAAAMTLPAMAGAVRRLLDTLGIAPMLAIGHSAGAAILLRLELDGGFAPRAQIGLNAALLPFGGVAAVVFSPLARLLAANDFTIGLLARRAADRMRVDEVLRGTGSNLPADDVAFYHRLFAARGHVAGAVQMMAGWDLAPLQRDLPRLRSRLVLLAGSDDRAIPPDQAFVTRERVPGSEVRYLRGVGHLAHEENAPLVAGHILDIVEAVRHRP